MCNLGELVDDDKNSVMALMRLRKTSDEIHLDFIPFPQGNRKRLENTSRFLMFCLHTTTNVAFSNISGNVLLHLGPPVSLTKITVHLGTTRVNRQRCIMGFLHDLISHKFEARHYNAVPEVQRTIFSNREIPVLIKVKLLLHQIDVSIFGLCIFNSLLKVRLYHKVIKRTLRNNSQIKLTQFCIKTRLSSPNHEVVAVGLAAQSISHYISLTRGIINTAVIVRDCFQPSLLTKVKIRLSE